MRSSVGLVPARPIREPSTLLELRAQLVHIVPCENARALAPVARVRRGAAVRERALSPRRASDDVISDGCDGLQGAAISWQKRKQRSTRRGYHAGEVTTVEAVNCQTCASNQASDF